MPIIVRDRIRDTSGTPMRERPMARRARSSRLETPEERRKLPVSKKPVFAAKIGRGLTLGYRRNQTGGTWVVRGCIGGIGGILSLDGRSRPHIFKPSTPTNIYIGLA
jgi:hypothetical protein